MKKMMLFLCAVFLLCSFGLANAIPVVYTNEAAYLSALADLGADNVYESFEGDAWNATRVTGDGVPAGVPISVESQGIGWWSNEGLGTHANYGRTGDWGIFDLEKQDSPDAIGVEVFITAGPSQLLFGVGGWFKPWTGTDLNSLVYYQVDNVVTDTDAIQIGSGYNFFGVIDSEGFGGILFQSNGEFGADDFTIGAAPVPEPATILLMGLGLFGMVGIRRRMNR